MSDKALNTQVPPSGPADDWSILDGSGACVFVADAEGRVQRINSTCCQLAGLPAHKALGRLIWQLVCDEHERPAFAAAIAQLAGGGRSRRLEVNFRAHTLIWTLTAVGAGAGLAITGVGLDLTGCTQERDLLAQRFRDVFENSPAPTLVVGVDGLVCDANRAAVSLLVGDKQELIGRPLSDFIVAEHHEDLRRALRQVDQAELGSAIEVGAITRDGAVRTLLLSPGRGSLREGACSVGTLLVGADITERQVVEQALRESQAKFRALMRVMPDMMFRMNADGVLLEYYTPDPRQLYVPGNQIVGSPLLQVIPLPAAKLNLECARRALATNDVAVCEYDLEVAAGQQTFEARHTAINDSEVLVIVRNITEAKEAERALRASESNYRMLVEEASDPILIHDETGRVLEANRRATQMLGFGSAELRTMTVQQFITAEHTGDVARMLQLAHGADHALLQVSLKTKEGDIIEAEVSAKGLGDGRVQQIVRDITQRRVEERALRRSEESFRLLIERSPNLVLVQRHGRVVYANQKSAVFLGFERGSDLIGMLGLDLVHPDDRPMVSERMDQAIQGQLIPPMEERLLRRDGSVAYAEVSAIPLDFQGEPSVIIVAHDLSERRRAEDERRQLQAAIQHTQQLESLGVLAGGIAHDFNNLLMGVLGNAGLAKMEVAADTPVLASLQRIETAALRAADLTRQLLAYSGRGKFVVQPVNLSHLVEEMVQLLETVISKKAVLQLQLDPALPAIEADPTQMRQVVMNLITNASDALGTDAGTISICTGVQHATRKDLACAVAGQNLPEGQYVYLDVRDTGQGMDELTISKVFDPFFSTKFAGRGLGLAAVVGIVRGHRGAVKVQSQLGAGTLFRVWFPVAAGAVVAPTPTSVRPPAPSAIRGSVLVVDDEESVRSVASLMLSRAGLQVYTAHDGQQALEMVLADPDRFDLVLLDMTMPRLNGDETLRAMRAVRSDLRIILSSGYNEQESVERVGRGVTGFLQKPYSPADLIDKVRHALGR